MIVHINGRPGTGKLTIGTALAERIGARLLDNHTIYNLAFALTEAKSPAFYEAVAEVREIAHRRVLDLPAEVPVVLTDAHFADSAHGRAAWATGAALARRRGCPYLVVVLDCAAEENLRRLQSPGRAGKRKPRDPALYPGITARRPLIREGGDRTLELDVTELSAEDAAAQIADWI
ncbi:AAA family ATPase [Pontivivens ytuae]|uniref:AAA family ATPase n=1 Tax=Pontivivens ytuae TaxID=2789856 RepID=A0A7S9LTN9_9RHOB|nr:AAA family ATPase [Pontivivens ytuae]QPH55112.1 AAA family ATPase [Pontivivens ytuae]